MTLLLAASVITFVLAVPGIDVIGLVASLIDAEASPSSLDGPSFLPRFLHFMLSLMAS